MYKFVEIIRFIKSGTNLNLVFDLLDEFEFQTRWSTLKLLNVLVNNQTHQLQEMILQIPRGVSRLMDLLNDTREVIRNDVSICIYTFLKIPIAFNLFIFNLV